MRDATSLETNSALFKLIDQFDAFEGTCDPAFDNEFDELERQFADLRLRLPSE